MSQEFTFSDPGEGLQEAEVLEIHVEEGAHVNDGDTVLTVETDKAATDIPAPFTGTVDKVHVKAGDVIRVDDVLLSYSPEGDERQPEAKEGDDKRDEGRGEPSDRETEETDDEKRKEPREERKEPREERKGRRQTPVPASPSTRRIAHERGIDLRDVEPSGPQGRVTTEDVEAASRGETRKRERREPSPLPDFSRWGETERQPMRSVRRVTAERMTQSWQEVPHVFHQDVADITELEHFRHEYEASAQANGGKFTLTILVMKALVFAMKRFPRFNASLDVESQEIVLKHYYNIGMAVATDRGLLVPVIRDVDRKNLIELTEAVSTTVEKARNGELRREDMEGGSMTLTNPGPLGGTALAPLINLPEVAILGLGQARLQPVVHGDLEDYEIKPRRMLPLSLGFDHRVNDGADAANFVTALIGALEDPQSLLLRI
ncbi:dihydrolipoamide acetyltransferase family protein [Litchfieldella rifensis]|uniref:Dihydrolipoamide acetyltransferase component of pyruvate dehydrogenase complex n=1 Tax=Litchfieldella rifensis TaxID=762643 RepID=A0ABV7LT24_9GAMM